ncbi:hypothetical protein N7540_005444 [Penicillium herquei]|nr:hypothetical protein N7540_005444 [Penicillium herquei]
MSTIANMQAPDKDNETIFSEFHDPERIALVHRILNIMRETEMPLANIFLLWFSKKEQLESMAREAEDCGPASWSSITTQYLINRLYDLVADVPGCWVQSGANLFPALVSKKCMASEADKEPQVRKDYDKKLIPLCYIRDRDECLVTKPSSPTLEAAHSVPFRLDQTYSGPRSVFQRLSSSVTSQFGGVPNGPIIGKGY